MIKHIVLFKMKEESTPDEIKKLAGELEGLKESTDGLMVECEVAKDVLRTERSYDLCLYSKFKTVEDVEKYGDHPNHVKVLETVKELCSAAVKVDYSVD